MTACIRNHFVLDCEVDAGMPEYYDGQAGAFCEIGPAEAAYGVLCKKCYGRTRYLMSQTPQLIGHIRAQVAPAMSVAQGQRVAGTRELPIPLNATAAEDSHELYAMVAGWMTGHARDLRIAPPASILESFMRDLDVAVLPAYAWQPWAANILTSDLRDWFLRNRIAIAALPSAGAFLDDRVDVVETLTKRYPSTPKVQRHQKRLCPLCGEFEVWPRWLGAGAYDVEVVCENCGYEIPRAYWDDFIDWGEW